jgi:hypothetical protein
VIESESGVAGYIVGAYAASPTTGGWDPDLEADYYAALAADPRVGALEVPWTGRLHPHDDEWLLAHLPASMRAVLTDIPRVALAVRDDPLYGLASDDADGRGRALRDAAALRDDVHRFHDGTGRRAVAAIELHSAPRASHGSAASLALSLADIARWDWEGAELVVEHCDALVPEHEPGKGFLALPDEVAAIRASATGAGIGLNWGRSAIELRDPDRVVEHVALARESGLLRACIVSGASDREGHYPAWADVHTVFRRSAEHPHGDADSLLTDDRVRAMVEAAGPDVALGVKLTWPAAVPGTVADRVGMIRDALDALDRGRAA